MAKGEFPNKELIRWIIETYDLPPSLKPRIISIAEQRIKELSLGSFDEQYRYISELIYKFTIPYSEKFALPLDAPIKDGSKTQFHEIIGIKNREEELKKHFNETFKTLEERLDDGELQVLLQLAQKIDENSLREFFSEGFLADSHEIKKHLEEICKKYEKHGQIILPVRPIKQIRFNPFYIKFGQRRFNGNPLSFFEKNKNIYCWINKKIDLLLFDQGLYSALTRANQLNKIVFKKYRGFSTPLDFFLHNSNYACLSRIDLRKKDMSLYCALSKKSQLKFVSRGYRGFLTPLDFLKANPEYFGLSRNKINRKDRSLYVSLQRTGQLENIPAVIREGYHGFKSPLEYFMAHPEYSHLTRGQLRKINKGLYNELSRKKQLKEAIPGKSYRGFDSPLDYFNAHSEIHNLNSIQLKKFDPGLYDSLSKRKQLKKAPIGKYRGSPDPLIFFRSYETYQGFTRGELKRIDGGLYNALCRRNQLQEAIPE